MTNTVAELNKKKWYRALKLLYIVSLIIVILFGLQLFREDLPTEHVVDDNYVTCNDGREISFLEFGFYTYTSSTDLEYGKSIRKACGLDKNDPLGLFDSNADELYRSNPSAKNYDVGKHIQTYGSYGASFKELLLYFFWVYLIFEGIRRGFYYIMLGRMNPKK